MRDLRRYWQEIRAIEQSLPPYVWLMSVDDPMRGHTGGSISEVGAAQAAKLLHAKSHRPASPEEIAEHKQRQSDAVRRDFEDDLRRRGISIVSVRHPAL